MNRLCLFVIAGVLAGCAHSNDMAMKQQLAADEVLVDNPGQVTVAGVTPAAALGAIDTQQVAEQPAVRNGGESSSDATPAEGAIAVEGAQPAAVLGAIDPTKLIDKNANKKPK